MTEKKKEEKKEKEISPFSYKQHSDLIQKNLETIVKNLSYLESHQILISSFIDPEKLTISRGLHFGSYGDAFHFNVITSDISSSKVYHIYVALTGNSKVPFTALLITDDNYKLPDITDYIYGYGFNDFLIYDKSDGKLTPNQVIIAYQEMMSNAERKRLMGGRGRRKQKKKVM